LLGIARAAWYDDGPPVAKASTAGESSMKIVIISDVHANSEALGVLPREYDELWILGDLVNYGPSPLEAVEFARAKASLIVRGNHDHSAGFGEDSRCSARFRSMAEATGRFTGSVLSGAQKQFLRELPLRAEREVDGVRFFACHATPSDPLYEYCPPDSDRWPAEARGVRADIVLIGHTHLPFQRRVGTQLIVNPGSLGQPKHGRPEACYAVWDGGLIELHSSVYPVEETVRKILALPLPAKIQEQLTAVLRNGRLPAGS
jgi:protein phosphatase